MLSIYRYDGFLRSGATMSRIVAQGGQRHDPTAPLPLGSAIYRLCKLKDHPGLDGTIVHAPGVLYTPRGGGNY